MSARTKEFYRSGDGQHYFNFEFVNAGSNIDIYCTMYPSLNGRDRAAAKTHLWPSGKLCFVAGREPKSQQRAEELAGQWAEYLLSYIKTGMTLS